MSIERVREYLRSWGLDQRVQEFDCSSATVELAAEALNCAPGRIAKSLSFLVQEKAILVIAAGDAKIDNSKFKGQFATKAKMLSPEQVVSMVGHVVGGVCPFAVNDGVEVYLDESLKRFDAVYPACGSSNSAIRLTIDELEQCAKPTGWVDVCKLPQAEF